MLSRILSATLLLSALASAAVTRVEVAKRTDLPVANYEQITGKVYFAVDPKLPANHIITDIDKAPKNASGQVEFSADLVVMRPKDKSKSNGTALLEISNRGGKGLLGMFDLNNGRDLSEQGRLQATPPCSNRALHSSGPAGNGTNSRARRA